MPYDGEERRQHCDVHDEYHETLTRVATNTDWIIKALKAAMAVGGCIFTIIVIPVAVWLVNLDKRVTNIETRLTLHINPEKQK